MRYDSSIKLEPRLTVRELISLLLDAPPDAAVQVQPTSEIGEDGVTLADDEDDDAVGIEELHMTLDNEEPRCFVTILVRHPRGSS